MISIWFSKNLLLKILLLTRKWRSERVTWIRNSRSHIFLNFADECLITLHFVCKTDLSISYINLTSFKNIHRPLALRAGDRKFLESNYFSVLRIKCILILKNAGLVLKPYPSSLFHRVKENRLILYSKNVQIYTRKKYFPKWRLLSVIKS